MLLFLLLVPQPVVTISTSMINPINQQELILTCIVTVVNGVPSSLVMVNWNETIQSLVSDQTNNGLQYTRMITFSPLNNDNAGTYTCSVSVTGFDEATNSVNKVVVVNGKFFYSLIK